MVGCTFPFLLGRAAHRALELAPQAATRAHVCVPFESLMAWVPSEQRAVTPAATAAALGLPDELVSSLAGLLLHSSGRLFGSRGGAASSSVGSDVEVTLQDAMRRRLRALGMSAMYHLMRQPTAAAAFLSHQGGTLLRPLLELAARDSAEAALTVVDLDFSPLRALSALASSPFIPMERLARVQAVTRMVASVSHDNHQTSGLTRQHYEAGSDGRGSPLSARPVAGGAAGASARACAELVSGVLSNRVALSDVEAVGGALWLAASQCEPATSSGVRGAAISDAEEAAVGSAPSAQPDPASAATLAGAASGAAALAASQRLRDTSVGALPGLAAAYPVAGEGSLSCTPAAAGYRAGPPQLEGLGRELRLDQTMLRVRAVRGFPSVRLAGVLLLPPPPPPPSFALLDGARSLVAVAPAAGRWYFEAVVLTPGVMQIGWADAAFSGDSASGQGVGDHLQVMHPPGLPPPPVLLRFLFCFYCEGASSLIDALVCRLLHF